MLIYSMREQSNSRAVSTMIQHRPDSEHGPDACSLQAVMLAALRSIVPDEWVPWRGQFHRPRCWARAPVREGASLRRQAWRHGVRREEVAFIGLCVPLKRATKSTGCQVPSSRFLGQTCSERVLKQYPHLRRGWVSA